MPISDKWRPATRMPPNKSMVAKRRQCGVQCLPVGSGVHGNRVHHAAGEDRHEQVGNGRYHHGEGDTSHQPCLAPPMAEEESKHVTHHVLISETRIDHSPGQLVDREAHLSDGWSRWLNKEVPQGMRKGPEAAPQGLRKSANEVR